MLIGEIFDEFISVIHENQKYVIGIINENKEVTLCSDKNLLGNTIDFNRPDKNNVFFEVNVKGQEFGYLWVNGHDDSLQMIGNLLHESLTVRLMFEINQANLNRKITKDDELVKCLLNEKDFDNKRIIDLMDDLGLNKDKTRVAIYMISSRGDVKTQDVARLKMNPDSQQIIYSLLNDRCLLVYKDIPDKLKEKEEIEEYIQKYIHNLIDWDFHDFYYFVGSVQHKLRQYVSSYQHCLWLKNNVKYEKNVPIFFEKYVTEYFLSKIDVKDVESVYNYYVEKGKEIDFEELTEISEALLNNDFNLTQAAESLFLHKNTLIYKLKKLEEIFQIDIRGSFPGKILLILISHAVKEQSNKVQVGD